MKTKLFILGVILIGGAIFLAGCASNKKEVNIFPIENPTGLSWCKYKIKKMNSTESAATIKKGKIICIKCPSAGKCSVYTRFKYGAFDMDVERVMKSCTSCPNQNHFDVGGPI